MGGLGNQMFQYAAGRALAQRYDTELLLETSFYNDERTGCTSRKFQLDHLQIRPTRIVENELVVDTEVSFTFLGHLKTAAREVLHSGENKLQRFREQSPLYNQDFARLPDNIYLDGYWQSEHYFSKVINDIRSEFVPVTDVAGKCDELLQMIGSYNSVSVHIRRGDYVTSPEVAFVHGVCAPDYYQTCMREISRQVESPLFVIFSDDIEWVKHNFNVPYRHILVEQDHSKTPEVDLSLMSLCNHNIIANSSFSWWGAWLNDNPEKIVYAPKKWFKDDRRTTDIVPERWRTI